MNTYQRTSLVLILACSGCFFDHPATESPPASNGVTLQYANGGGDLATHPVAAGGARTTIDVLNGTFDEARSSDPNVATFTASGNEVEVVSGNAGSAIVQVLFQGRLLASGTVIVVDTSSLAVVNQGWTGKAPTLVAGAGEVLHVTTLGADGNSTRGDGAVHFELDGDLAAAVVPVDGDAIGLSGLLPDGVTSGTGTVVASCPGAKLAQTINVVAPSLVTQLVVESPPTAGSDGQISVAIAAQLADGTAVFSDPCLWSVSDSSVTLADQLSGLQVGPGSLSFFNLTRPGTFTATCTMAGLTRAVTLQR